jgi:putative acetyltransferase
MQIRNEQSSDHDAIREVIREAFATHPYSTQNEHRIVDALRDANALTVALVAIEEGAVVGYVACSPVSIDCKAGSWFGLGPIAVIPNRQDQGIGGELIQASVLQLKAQHAGGIVLLGDPEYYTRFGFVENPKLILPDVPPSHFLSLPLGDNTARGVVTYHHAFSLE